jgi:hypothetical protein
MTAPDCWLVPSVTAIRRNFFVAGERYSVCGQAKRDKGRTNALRKCAVCTRLRKR